MVIWRFKSKKLLKYYTIEQVAYSRRKNGFFDIYWCLHGRTQLFSRPIHIYTSSNFRHELFKRCRYLGKPIQIPV